jgi:hypothetical protein
MPQNFLNVRQVVNTATGDNSISLPILMVESEGGKSVPGLSIHGQFPGLIPPFMEHSARKSAGYTIPEWRAVHFLERALEVAQYMIERRIEAEEYEAMNKK